MPLDEATGTTLRWTLVARPFSTERQEREACVGLSLAQMLEASELPRRYWSYLQVFVDDQEIPSAWWGRVRPKASPPVMRTC